MFVGTAQTGGSTLYTIKWTGLEPKEDGWSPPSDTGNTLGQRRKANPAAAVAAARVQ